MSTITIYLLAWWVHSHNPGMALFLLVFSDFFSLSHFCSSFHLLLLRLLVISSYILRTRLLLCLGISGDCIPPAVPFLPYAMASSIHFIERKKNISALASSWSLYSTVVFTVKAESSNHYLLSVGLDTEVRVPTKISVNL